MFGGFHFWYIFFFKCKELNTTKFNLFSFSQVFKNGGAAFLIPFFLMLFLVGIPIFFLEISVGQFSGLASIDAFSKMVPLFKGKSKIRILIASHLSISEYDQTFFYAYRFRLCCHIDKCVHRLLLQHYNCILHLLFRVFVSSGASMVKLIRIRIKSKL